MNNQKAIQILVDSVKLANRRGAFELNESAVIAQAVSFFTASQKLEEEPVKQEGLKEEKKGK